MIAILLWLVAALAHGNTYRFGLFVGNNEGLTGEVPLLFAESDAEKMRDLFVTYGGLEGRDATLLLGATERTLFREFDQVGSRIRDLVGQGHEVSFVFYYSGHGDADALHLGASKFAYENLRFQLERTGAQVRVAMVDACQSGGLVRRKGGQRGPSLAFASPTVESMQGTAIITSSAASELSQESAEIGGGFFTHYLHTALTGGADEDRDGEVTLSEAYDYVHAETAFQTRDTPEAQTPHGDFDLSGAGPVVLTRLEDASARIAFLGDLEGTYSVWDESRKRYVAEVDGARALSIAVRPGSFFVHRRMPGWVEEAAVVVRRGETRSVLGEDFAVVSYAATASRGDLEQQIRRARIPDLSVRLVLGGRGPASTTNPAAAYLGAVPVGGVQFRWLSRRTSYVGFDVLGGRGVYALPFTGLEPVRTRLGTASVMVDTGVATRPALFRLGVGARLGTMVLTREFPDWDVAPQLDASFVVGGEAWIGVHRGRFSADLQYNLGFLATAWDGASVPATGDLLLTMGFRL